jgi:hypothetical protein
MSRRVRSYKSAPARRRAVAEPRRKSPARRRQHVALRGRRREELSRRFSGIARRGLILLAGCAVVALFCFHSDSWIRRQLTRHTPIVDVEGPSGLAALPVLTDLPAHRWLLWIPGIPFTAAHRMTHHFVAVRTARLETHFSTNRVIVHLYGRKPLVQWNGSGVDADGVVFPLITAPDAALPQLLPNHTPPARTLGHWLTGLSREPWIWNSLQELKEDAQGHWTLVSTSGPVLLWGLPDEDIAKKANALKKVLADAQDLHGGALRADLRFFGEGRIIVGVRRTLH